MKPCDFALKFKTYSFDMIKAIKNDDISMLNILVLKRQELIEDFSKDDYALEDLQRELEGNKIMDIEKELSALVSKAMEETKEAIEKGKIQKQANKAYNNTGYAYQIFNRHI